MKRILIMVAILVPFIANSQTYFKNGMKWVMHTSNIFGSTGLKEWTHTVTAEKSPDDDSLMLYETYDDEPERKFIGYVKTEGEKVFFRADNSESAEWFLMYDFGLKPGEGCYIYSARYVDKNLVPMNKSYVKCVALNEKSSQYDGWFTMSLKEYPDESCSGVFTADLVWIKGLCSDGGVMRNGSFFLDGESGSVMTDVYWNNERIYKGPTTGISQVTDDGSIEIRIDGLNLYVTAAGEAQGALYTPSGMLLGNYRFGSEPVTVNLPSSGIYILKAGGEMKKILVP